MLTSSYGLWTLFKNMRLTLETYSALAKSCIIATAVLIPALSFSQENPDDALIKKADRIHKRVLTVDTHNDTALCLNNPGLEWDVTKGQVTFPLMKEGGLDAAFFAFYTEQGKRDSLSLNEVNSYAWREMTKFKNYVESYDGAAIAYNTKDLLRNKKKGIISVILAIENGNALGNDVKEIEKFYKMGVRAITLCHNRNNNICDASLDSTEHGGLSEFGCLVVKEMNRLGIIIDLSHASTATLYDVLKVSKLPVMASHSGVYNIKNHKRNLKDDEIKAIAAKGGLIQVATGRFFLSNKPKDQVTVDDLADHIDYVKNLVGIEHVGLGTDFDGGGGVVGMENASKMKNLTIELLRRGYSERDLQLFWGGNLLRLLKIHFM